MARASSKQHLLIVHIDGIEHILYHQESVFLGRYGKRLQDEPGLPHDKPRHLLYGAYVPSPEHLQTAPSDVAISFGQMLGTLFHARCRLMLLEHARFYPLQQSSTVAYYPMAAVVRASPDVVESITNRHRRATLAAFTRDQLRPPYQDILNRRGIYAFKAAQQKGFDPEMDPEQTLETRCSEDRALTSAAFAVN
jgi:hypothetical protein